MDFWGDMGKEAGGQRKKPNCDAGQIAASVDPQRELWSQNAPSELSPVGPR